MTGHACRLGYTVPPTDERCRITVWCNRSHCQGWPCGEPAVSDRLCARHHADLVRLGGAS